MVNSQRRLGEEQDVYAFELTWRDNEREGSEDEKPSTCGWSSKEVWILRIIRITVAWDLRYGGKSLNIKIPTLTLAP